MAFTTLYTVSVNERKKCIVKSGKDRLMTDIIEFYNTKRPHISNVGMLPPRRMRELFHVH